MDVWSPKDGFVVKLYVENGKRVASGTLLLDMDVDEESRHRARIDTMDKVRAEMASQYQGEEERIAKGIAQANLNLAKFRVDQLDQALRDTQDQHKVGQMTSLDVTKAVLDLQKARTDYVISQADQAKLNFSIERHQRINDLVAAQLNYERQVLDQEIKRLSVAAPIAGTIELRVAENSFCGIGDLLLVIG